jgi:hypothetical protein
VLSRFHGRLTTHYQYHDGHWDGAEREFRGFGFVEQFDSESFETYSSSGLQANGATLEVAVERLKHIDLLGNEIAGAAARTIDGTISTRRGNGSPWLPLVGAGPGAATPFGTWELSVRNANAVEAQQLQEALDKDLIEDILLVLSFEADTPPWPA